MLYMFFVIFVAALGPFQFGYNTGVINAPAAVIKSFIVNETTDVIISEEGITFAWPLAVSMFSVGGMLGSLLVGYGANVLGRRLFMFILAIAGVACGFILGFAKMANSYILLVLGRMLVGFVSGAYTGVTPMYLSEVSPLAIRGSIGVVNQLAIVSALLISQVLGLVSVWGNEQWWPLLLGFTGVPAAMQAILVLIVCPESPRFLLITRSDEYRARQNLKRLGSSESEIEDAITEMRREAEIQRQEKTLTVVDLFKRRELFYPLGVAVVMQLSQQLSGINGIFYYSSTLFEKSANLSPEDAGLATLGVGAIMVVMTFVTIFLIDRLGRKVLHSLGLGGMLVSAICVTIFLSIKEVQWASYAGVAFCLLFVTFFGLGPGAIPWLITSELFAQSARPPAIAVATFVNWSANFAVGMAFEPIQKAIDEKVFIIFAVLLLIFLIFTVIVVPETKGKTFQEIASHFTSSNPSTTNTSPCYGDAQKPRQDVGVSQKQLVVTSSEISHLSSDSGIQKPNYLAATQL